MTTNTMTLSPVLLALLCSLQLMAVPVPTCQLQGNMVEDAHNLLRHLGGEFPPECLPYNANISFPSSALSAATANHSQCHRASWVVFKSLEEAELIFEDNDSPVGVNGVTWDQKRLDQFRHLTDRLVGAGGCLPSVDDSGVLSTYFSHVTVALQQQESAACGWLALNRDLRRVLKSTLSQHHSCFTWRHAH
ncbi:interferon phi 3 [Centropristis striata]|uniref:interferon phi 3 n=1 Tax=Centropristis striata TaxID=184440 RepID=UPI0027DF0FE8|nr:interferon phi 3 [Centropristis striata]